MGKVLSISVPRSNLARFFTVSVLLQHKLSENVALWGSVTEMYCVVNYKFLLSILPVNFRAKRRAILYKNAI